jgi:hypothetical protein
MGAKVNPHSRRAPATPPGDTATYEQLQGSSNGRAESRKVEKMPHERDESASDTGNRLDEPVTSNDHEIAKAHDDIEQGRKDTDRRGVPDDVPGSRENRGR